VPSFFALHPLVAHLQQQLAAQRLATQSMQLEMQAQEATKAEKRAFASC